MSRQAPKFSTGVDGKKHPIAESGVEVEYIGSVQVVRDGHLMLGNDPDKPAATAERRDQGKGGIGDTLGSFLLGDVFEAGRSNAIDVSAVGKVRFPGAKKIQKQRFRRLTPIENVAQDAAMREGSGYAEEPVVSVADWLVCLTKPGEDREVKAVKAKLAKLGDIEVLQIQGSFPVYPADTRITLCPANVEDPTESSSSGKIVACMPTKTGCNVVYEPFRNA